MGSGERDHDGRGGRPQTHFLLRAHQDHTIYTAGIYKNYLRTRKNDCSQFSSVQLLSHVQLFATPWTTARQASLSITKSWNLLRLMSTELVMPSNHLILCCPILSYLQSFPALGSFSMGQFFISGGQSIGASASAAVLPMNTQG